MSMQLSKQEVDILNSLKDLKLKEVDGKRVDNNIFDSIQSGMQKDFGTNADDSGVAEFTKGFSVAIAIGISQCFNKDRKMGDRLEFGYTGLNKHFSSVILLKSSSYESTSSTDEALESGLNVKIREVTPEDYIQQGYYHADIALLGEIFKKDINDGYDEDLLKAISENGDIATQINAYMSDLETVYRLAFEDGFGIHPFAGVLSDKNAFITIDSNSINAVEMKDGEATLKKLAQRICSKINGKVGISDMRQFDYKDIDDCDKVVYFPYKILEYALGRESTLNLNKYEYLPSANSVSWDTYYKKYVADNLRNILLRGYYYIFKKLADSHGVAEDNADFIKDCLANKNDNDFVTKYINKLYNSMRCFYFLSRYSCVTGQIAEIRMRVSSASEFPCFSGNKSVSEHLFKGLITQNDKEEFKPPFELSRDRVSSRGIKVSTDIYEYQYDVNPMLSQAEPLFGYTIQRQNQIRGTKSDWNRILIGEDMTGKELYASPNSDIKLQNNFTHNIIAGSRSGKGVMTMNILASAIAAGKPVFYLDRKPDMASMLYNLSDGSQFIVNGGLINAEFDVGGKFDEYNGEALAYWRSGIKYLNSSPKILELFGVGSTGYNGILGDYVYFRAFMFCLGLCVLRSKMKGKMDGERNQYLNGDGGIVIVVDELTGFENSISSLLSTISSPMVQKALNMGDADALLRKKSELEGKILIQEEKISEEENKEKPRQSQITAEKLKLKQLQEDLENLVDEQSLYAGTLFAKIKESYATLMSSKVAGFKGKEFNYSDIFVLGQNLEVPYYASSLTATNKGSISPVFFPLTSDKKDYYSAYKGADIIRSFLEELGELDWFLGRNPDYTKYGGKNDDAQAKKEVDDNGNWEYVGKHTCNEIRGIDKSDFNNPVLFKPYLVLNMSDEEDPANTQYDEKGNPVASKPEFQYVAQCRDRVNKSAGGMDLWATVRTKHLNDVAKKDYYSTGNSHYNCLDEGIGFKGLIRDTLATSDPNIKSGTVDMNVKIAEVLGMSGSVADYVAKCMGYSCWQELIFDFTPQGLFSFDDMVNAVMNPELYQPKARFPLYAKLNALDKVGTTTNRGIEHSSSANNQSSEDIEPTNSNSHPSEATEPINIDSRSPEIPVNKETQTNECLQYMRMPDEQLMVFAQMIVASVKKALGREFSNEITQKITQSAFEKLRERGF